MNGTTNCGLSAGRVEFIAERGHEQIVTPESLDADEIFDWNEEHPIGGCGIVRRPRRIKCDGCPLFNRLRLSPDRLDEIAELEGEEMQALGHAVTGARDEKDLIIRTARVLEYVDERVAIRALNNWLEGVFDDVFNSEW